jgi:serine/threonine protein kinase
MYLRKQRFAHGNLRPSNLLVDSCGNLKLTDYFVKELEETFHPLPCLKSSSVAYLAPEVLRHTPFVPFGVDSASDVYSFGIICAELISGVEPFRNFSVPQIRALVGYGGYRQPAHPQSRLKALNKLVAKCTLQDPLARPTFERLVVALNSLQRAANTAAEDALITFISGK